MLAALTLLLALAQTPAPVQRPAPTHTFVFLKSGPNKDPVLRSEAESGMTGHLANLTRLWKEGLSPAAGPFGDRTDYRGIVVLKGDHKELATTHFASDPFIKSGRMVAVGHPWIVEGNPFAEVKEDAEMASYGVVLLLRGPKRGDPVSDEAKKLAAGHGVFLKALDDAGRLGVAGPFLDDGEVRGIIVFRDSDEPSIRKAMEADPAVEAGWLKVEYHPLWMAKGIFKAR